jgi:IS30 family transposase
MGIHYSHLSINDRVRIEVLLRLGARQSAVARLVGCHRSTICRELTRAKSFGLRSYIADFGRAATGGSLGHQVPRLRQPIRGVLRGAKGLCRSQRGLVVHERAA